MRHGNALAIGMEVDQLMAIDCGHMQHRLTASQIPHSQFARVQHWQPGSVRTEVVSIGRAAVKGRQARNFAIVRDAAHHDVFACGDHRVSFHGRVPGYRLAFRVEILAGL